MLTSDSQRISYRQERRYRYSIVVSVSEKELGDDVQTVAENALCLPAMFLDLDFPDVTVDVLADIVAPHEGDHHQEQQLADTIQVREMRVFDVEACALYSCEAHRLPDLQPLEQSVRLGTVALAWVVHPFVCDGEHEDVDARAAELPVCPVNDQHFLPVAGQERVQESGDEVVVKVEFRKKTLDSPQT